LTVVVLGWEHPDGWPNPVTLWQLGLDLHSSVLEVEGVDSSDSGTLDWVDDIATSSCASLATVESVGGALVGWSSTPEVNVSTSESIFSESVSREGWLQVKDTFLDEGVGSVVGVVLELPVATTTHGDLVLPGSKVEGLEFFIKDQSLSG